MANESTFNDIRLLPLGLLCASYQMDETNDEEDRATDILKKRTVAVTASAVRVPTQQEVPPQPIQEGVPTIPIQQMSTTGNGYRHEGRSSVRFSMDADTKEVLTAIAATRSAHRSSIYSAVSDVSFGFEDGDDFDDEHGARDDMSMSKASGYRGGYEDEEQDDDDYLEANYHKNNRSANQRRESTFSHGTMATAGTTGTAGTSGTMDTIQTVQMMEKQDSDMSSFSQFTFNTMSTIQTACACEKRDSAMSSFSQFTFTDD